MDPNTYEVQQHREDARAAITEKIELLEERVRDTVEDAREKLTLAYHVNQRPWQILGLSIAVGYVLGRRFLAGTYPTPSAVGGKTAHLSSATEAYASSASRPEQSRSSGVFERHQGGFKVIRDAAVGVITSVVLNVIKDTFGTSGLRSEKAASARSEKRRASSETVSEPATTKSSYERSDLT